MCIALVCEPGKRVSNDVLWRGWSTNRDGGGFAFVQNGEVVIDKGYMEYNPFQTALNEAWDNNPDSPFLVHMRIATSGLRSRANTHPFRIEPSQAAMIHNGILFEPAGEWEGTADDRKSDTRVVAEALGSILDLETLLRSRDRIGVEVGGGNKLCFLYPDKTTVIVNENSGWWNGGIWYSNGSCGVPRAQQ